MEIKSNIYTKIPFMPAKNLDGSSIQLHYSTNFSAKELAEMKEWRELLKNNPLAFNFVPSHLLECVEFLQESREVLKESVKTTFKVSAHKARGLTNEIICSRLDDEMSHQDDCRSLWSGF